MSDDGIDLQWMARALDEAAGAARAGEVPVGAVIISEGEVVGSGANRRQQTLDPTDHAEIVALRSAAAALGSRLLLGATLYVTLEPCPMCAGAILAARIRRVVFGAFDPKAGAAGTLYNLLDDPRLNHQVEVSGGVLADEAGSLLTDFFRSRRPLGADSPTA